MLGSTSPRCCLGRSPCRWSDVERLLGELSALTRGGRPLTTPNSAAGLLAQWLHTAKIYREPALLEIINREPAGDFNAVERPQSRTVSSRCEAQIRDPWRVRYLSLTS